MAEKFTSSDGKAFLTLTTLSSETGRSKLLPMKAQVVFNADSNKIMTLRSVIVLIKSCLIFGTVAVIVIFLCYFILLAIVTHKNSNARTASKRQQGSTMRYLHVLYM